MITITPGSKWEPVRWDRWKEIAPGTHLVEKVWGAVVQESLWPPYSERRPLLNVTLSPFWERAIAKKEGGYWFEGRIEWVAGPRFHIRMLAIRLAHSWSGWER